MTASKKKTYLRLIAIFCVCLQVTGLAFMLANTDKTIQSAILSANEVPDNFITRGINNRNYHARLIPTQRPKAREEEHVLYALRHEGATDFLSAREREMLRITEYFASNYTGGSNTIDKIYSAVTFTCYLINYNSEAERDTAYSLINRQGVCSNFSRTTQLLLASVNVDDVLYVVGDVNDTKDARHAWLIAKLDDGTFVHIDPTWSDNANYINQFRRIRPTLKWLLIDDDTLSETRSWDRELYPKADTNHTELLREIKEKYYET